MKHEVESPSTVDKSRPKRTLASDIARLREHVSKNPEGIVVPPVVLLGAAAFTAVTLNVGANLTDPQNQEPSHYADILDTNTTQLVIKDGANLRNDPVVRNGETDNLIDRLDLDQGDDTVLIVHSPDGIYIKENTVDGDWYGIPAADLANVDGTEDDKDGIVWINDAKAYPANSPTDN